MTSATQAIEAELAAHPHGRVPRDLRRRQLLAIAADLFTERGYAAASMDELAARAGVTKPIVYGIFGSKEGLLLGVIDELGAQLNEAVRTAVAGRTSPAELLREGSLAFFTFVRERLAVWTMAFGASRSLGDASPSAADRLDAIRRRQDELVSAVLLASAQELGNKPDPLELGAVTRGLNGVYEGLVEWWADHPEVEPERMTEWVVALVLPGLEAMAGAGDGAGRV